MGLEARKPVAQVEELRVHAVKSLPRPVVSALHADAALRQRVAGDLHAAVSVTRALLLLEDLHVDLTAEDLVDATHESVAGFLVVEDVERGAVAGDAARGMHEPVAERAALPALVLEGWTDWGPHAASVGRRRP